MFGKKKSASSENLEQVASASWVASQLAAAQAAPDRLNVRSERVATFKSGVIYLDISARLQVAVTNLDAHGARIDFIAHAELPKQISIVIGTAKRVRAEVVWQTGHAAGIRFLPAER